MSMFPSGAWRRTPACGPDGAPRRVSARLAANRLRTDLRCKSFTVHETGATPLLPDDRGYERCFDVFEYLCALAFIDVQRQRPDPVGWYPPGRFFWRWSVVDKLNEETRGMLFTELTASATIHAGVSSCRNVQRLESLRRLHVRVRW
jgi:hypothetical protein